MHLLLTEPGDEPFLLDELSRGFASASHELLAPSLVRTDLALQPEAPLTLAFSRQLLPAAEALSATSIREWSERLFDAVCARVVEGQPWRLHIAPHYGEGGTGGNRVRLMREAFKELLRKKRRHLLRALEEVESPFRENTSLVQLLLTAPDAGFLSVGLAPLPWQLRRSIWPFVKGELPVASDKAAMTKTIFTGIQAALKGKESLEAGSTELNEAMGGPSEPVQVRADGLVLTGRRRS